MFLRTVVRCAVELKTFIHPHNRMPIRYSKSKDTPYKLNGKVHYIEGVRGLVTASGCKFTDNHYEIARVTINRLLPPKVTMRQHSYVRYGVTRKPNGSRMGGGKGEIKHYEYRLRPHTPLFELFGNIHPLDAEYILKQGAKVLPGHQMVVETGPVFPKFEHLKVAERREQGRLAKEKALEEIKAKLDSGEITPNMPAGPTRFAKTKYFPYTFSIPTPNVLEKQEPLYHEDSKPQPSA